MSNECKMCGEPERPQSDGYCQPCYEADNREPPTHCLCGAILQDDDEIGWEACTNCVDQAGDWEDYNNSRMGSSLDNQPMNFDGRFHNG